MDLSRPPLVVTFELSERRKVIVANALAGASTVVYLTTRLIQFMIAGVDFIPLGELPEGVPVATNGGGYAESMAEHALAMTLAAAKRLIVEHENLKRGQFNQFTRNRMLAGGVWMSGLSAASHRPAPSGLLPSCCSPE